MGCVGACAIVVVDMQPSSVVVTSRVWMVMVAAALMNLKDRVVVPSHLTYFQYDHMSLYGQALA